MMSAYKKLALKNHPDKVGQRGGNATEVKEATEKFKEISNARDLLLEDFKNKDARNGPTAGSNPTQGSNPTAGSNPTEGSNPTQGSNPTAGSNPTEGSNPTAGSNPTEGSNPTAGFNPTAGSNPTAGFNPTEGSNPTAGSSPTETPDDIDYNIINYDNNGIELSAGPDTTPQPNNNIVNMTKNHDRIREEEAKKRDVSKKEEDKINTNDAEVEPPKFSPSMSS